MPPNRLLALALAFGVPLAALASVVKAETLAQMVDATPVVVHARIHQVQVAADEAKGRTFTYAEVEVLEALKGQVPPRFLVRQTGGTVGGRTVHVEGAPRFEEGSEAVLFLEPAADEPSLYLVHALAAGKFDVEKNKVGEVRVTRHLDGLAFAQPGAHTVTRVRDVEDDGTPEAFLTKLKALIAGGAR